MKLINRLPLRFSKRSKHWTPIADIVYAPHMCHMELKRWFAISTENIIYATVSTNKPTSPHLQASYYHFRVGADNLDVDLRAPGKSRECEWEEVPTLLSLDTYLQEAGLKPKKKYFVWFETD